MGPFSYLASLSECDKQLIVCAKKTATAVGLVPLQHSAHSISVPGLRGLCHYCPVNHHITVGPARVGVAVNEFSVPVVHWQQFVCVCIVCVIVIKCILEEQCLLCCE